MVKKIILVLVLYLIIVALSVAWVTDMQTNLFQLCFLGARCGNYSRGGGWRDQSKVETEKTGCGS